MPATLNPWTRVMHEHLRELSAQKGRPVGLTVLEAFECAEIGPAPFDEAVTRRLMRQAAVKGWFTAVREPLVNEARKGGSQATVRYFAAADLPADAAPEKPNSYFDGLVRASSVFELAAIVGASSSGRAS